MNENEKAPASLNPEDQPITGIKQQEHHEQFNPDRGIMVATNLPIMPPLPQPISIKLDSDQVQLSQSNYNIPQITVQDEVTLMPYGLDADGLSEADREFYAGIAAAGTSTTMNNEYNPGMTAYACQAQEHLQETEEASADNYYIQLEAENNIGSFDANRAQNPILPQIREVDPNLSEQDGCYYYKNKRISNCLIKIDRVFQPSGDVSATFICSNGYQTQKIIDYAAFGSTGKLVSALKDTEISLKTSEAEFKSLREYIFDGNYKRVQELSIIGFSEVNGVTYFADSNYVIDMNGNKTSDVVLAQRDSGIKSNILSYNPITTSELSSILPAMLGFNTPERVLAFWGSCCSFFLNYKLMKLKIKMPHLNLYGLKGSGKSTTVEFGAMPLFSVATKASIGKVSVAAMKRIISSSNVIPFICDEYKPSTMSPGVLKEIWEMLRSVYDRSDAKHAGSGKNVIDFQLTAPCIVAGEEAFTEPALIERSMIVRYVKKERTKAMTACMDFLKMNEEQLHKLGRSLLNEAMKFNDNEILYWLQQSGAFFEKNIEDPRIVHTAAMCSLGIHLLNRVLGSLGLNSVSASFGLNPDETAGLITKAVHAEMTDSDGTSKSVIDYTLEIIDSMIANGALDYDLDYKIVDSKTVGTYLALNIPVLFPKFTKFVRAGYPNQERLTDWNQLQKQMTDVPYYLDQSSVKFNKNATAVVKAYRFSKDGLLNSGLDIPYITNLLNNGAPKSSSKTKQVAKSTGSTLVTQPSGTVTNANTNGNIDDAQ